MKAKLVFSSALAAASVATLLQTIPAHAASLTVNYDCFLSSTGCAPTTSYGTLTLSDTTFSGLSAVQISSTLTGAYTKFLELSLNYLDSKFSNTSPFNLTSGRPVGVDENNVNPNGGGSYKGFDLVLPKNGNLNTFNTYSDVLYLQGQNLTVADLTYLDQKELLFAAVHLGAGPDGKSITLGSTPIPTPALLPGLIGLGLGIFRKRKGESVQAEADA